MPLPFPTPHPPLPQVVREYMKDTDQIEQYKHMRETLVYLTHLDHVDTERIMTEKLAKQVCAPCV